jgi:hypothetical protein
MRKRLLIFLKPNPIAHVDKTTAERAFPEVLCFAQRRSAELFAHAAPAWSRLVDWHMIAVTYIPLKNLAPVSRGPILYGARRTSGRAAIVVHIVTRARAGQTSECRAVGSTDARARSRAPPARAGDRAKASEKPPEGDL